MSVSALHVQRIIRERAIARADRERRQRSLLPDNEIFAETIRQKLDGLLWTNQFTNFQRCGCEDFFRTCRDCGAVEKRKYQCSIKWCPRCNWKISERRKTLLQHFTQKVSQPKHLVLTQKNFRILTRSKLQKFGRALASLRRTKVFDQVNGGCVSIEITNEGNGWHVHAHCLIDVRWLDMAEVSRVWGRCVGQNFGIVKIKDVRGQEYLKEICKYVVDGSALAGWPAEQILEFVQAVRGKRFFFSFGSLRKLAPTIRAEIEAEKSPPPVCDCGCENFIWQDALAEILEDSKSLSRHSVRVRGVQLSAKKSADYGRLGTQGRLSLAAKELDKISSDGQSRTCDAHPYPR